jgi:hypothetical protein
VADKVWTAEDLERLRPAEQDAVFESSLATDVASLPADFLERVRTRAQQRIADDELRRQ